MLGWGWGGGVYRHLPMSDLGLTFSFFFACEIYLPFSLDYKWSWLCSNFYFIFWEMIYNLNIHNIKTAFVPVVNKVISPEGTFGLSAINGCVIILNICCKKRFGFLHCLSNRNKFTSLRDKWCVSVRLN